MREPMPIPAPLPRDSAGISIRSVTMRFGTQGSDSDYLALRDVSLEVQRCEFVSLLGRSGCGKSTLLRIVAGLLAPTSGSVLIDGQPVTRPTRRVGFVFQSATLLPWYSLLDNILLPHRIAGTLDRAARQRAGELLEITGLSGHQKKFPRELSGGMQQRASIARALVTSPDLLLMDEPFSALDEFTRETLNDELLRIWSESRTTILFVTHNIAEAVYLSDRIAVMDSHPGRIRSILPSRVPRPRHAACRTGDAYYETITAVRRAFGTDDAEPASASASGPLATAGV
ncbi:MAG: ABC transporter ATP-binding protein [Burkholderiales bacterium]|nr:ABC transporter ATP-binding protein [Burkholderiales bacterium]